jgi:uncharacterized protein (TIGR03118 family)
MVTRSFRLAVLMAALVVGLVGSATGNASAVGANRFTETKLISNLHGVARTRDPNLVNAWGLAAGPSTPWWVADNGTNRSTIYTGSGLVQNLVVHVNGAPTGAVFNGGGGFVVSDGTNSGSSLFIFSNEAGTIRGWSPAVSSTDTFVIANRTKVGAVFKGLAISPDSSMIYATDFVNGRVDVFDSTGALVHMPGAFTDPNLPNHFAPFGIQTLAGNVFVTYAKQDPHSTDEMAGPGLGFVDMYAPDGTLLGRAVSRGRLNAPWGLAIAPAGFGPFGGDLLVGNFGNGKINAYAITATGSLEGTLHDQHGDPLVIDGLWALEFGMSGPSGSPNALFFTAGPNEEADGLFGKITQR